MFHFRELPLPDPIEEMTIEELWNKFIQIDLLKL